MLRRTQWINGVEAISHGGSGRSPFPQRPGCAGDRDRGARVHVRRRQAPARPPPCLPRHGRRPRDHLPLLLDALPPRHDARSAGGAAGRVRLRAGRRLSGARTIAVAGAGIGGLTAALALAARGFRVALFDRAARLEETGAGIQLSPNATRILDGLGLRARLLPSVVAPDAVMIRTAQNAALARLPLGPAAETRYGAPYWMIHRGDLQAALLDAALAHRGITLTLGAAVDDCTVHADGVAVQVLRGVTLEEMSATALIGADGLWSSVRTLVGETEAARSAQ